MTKLKKYEWSDLTVYTENVTTAEGNKTKVTVYVNGVKSVEKIINLVNTNKKIKLSKAFVGRVKEPRILKLKKADLSFNESYKRKALKHSNTLFNMDFNRLYGNKIFSDDIYGYKADVVPADISLTKESPTIILNSFQKLEFKRQKDDNIIGGDQLNECTFYARIKVPATNTYADSNYIPILSRKNVFSFGLKNKTVDLFFNDSNSNIVRPDNITNILDDVSTYNTVLYDNSFDNTEEFSNNNTKIINNANSLSNIDLDNKLIYNETIFGSKYIVKHKESNLEINKNLLIGNSFSNISFSGWFNYDQTSQPEFSLFKNNYFDIKYNKNTSNIII